MVDQGGLAFFPYAATYDASRGGINFETDDYVWLKSLSGRGRLSAKRVAVNVCFRPRLCENTLDTLKAEACAVHLGNRLKKYPIAPHRPFRPVCGYLGRLRGSGQPQADD